MVEMKFGSKSIEKFVTTVMNVNRLVICNGDPVRTSIGEGKRDVGEIISYVIRGTRIGIPSRRRRIVGSRAI